MATIQQTIKLRKSLGIKPRRRLPDMSLPKKYERAYYKIISLLVLSELRKFSAELKRRLNALRQDSARQDGVSEIRKFFISAKLAIGDNTNRIEKEVTRVGEEINAYNQGKIQSLVPDSLGVNLLADNTKIAKVASGYVAESVSLITSIHERYFSEIENIVFRGVADGTTNREIAKDIQRRFGVTKSRSRLIARDQTGKLYGRINRTRQKSIGIKKYIWRTSLDERVRSLHQPRHGREFSWSHGPSDGHPGEPIQCRCYAEPILPE